MVNKQLKYTYFPVSQEVKGMKFGQLIEHNMRNIIHKMWWGNYSQTLL